MTTEEFIQKHRGHQSHLNRRAVLSLLFLFGILFSGAIIDASIPAKSKLTELILAATLLIALIGQVPLLFWLIRRETRKHGLHCPACDKELAGVNAQIAIAASRCGHCGAKVFSDDDPANKGCQNV